MPELDRTGFSGTDDDERRIITAAWQILERSHFRTLKVRQVLIASGVSANGFYRRFPGKSHLLIALVRDEMDRATARLVERMAAAAGPDAQLRVWIEELVAIAYDGRRAERARMFLDPVLYEELPDEIDRLHQATVTPLRDLIATAGGTDPDAAAKAIAHMVRGFTGDRLAGVLDWPRARVVETVFRLAARALKP